MEPREHFSSFLNKDIIRNGHWRGKGASRAFLIIFNKNVIRRNTGGEKGAMRAFLIILNKNVMGNEYWRARERGEHFSSVFNEDVI